MNQGRHAITIEIDQTALAGYTDSYLALAWQVAQANPAPHGDKAAGELAEYIGREIIRRWLRKVPAEMWSHQGRDHYWSELVKLARYEPGGPSGTPEWDRGTWVPKDDVDQADAEPSR